MRKLRLELIQSGPRNDPGCKFEFSLQQYLEFVCSSSLTPTSTVRSLVASVLMYNETIIGLWNDDKRQLMQWYSCVLGNIVPSVLPMKFKEDPSVQVQSS